MRYLLFITIFAFTALASCNFPSKNPLQPQNIFSVKGEKTFLNDKEILLRGLRLSKQIWKSITATGSPENLMPKQKDRLPE